MQRPQKDLQRLTGGDIGEQNSQLRVVGSPEDAEQGRLGSIFDCHSWAGGALLVSHG